jgi:hypothetical protein
MRRIFLFFASMWMFVAWLALASGYDPVSPNRLGPSVARAQPQAQPGRAAVPGASDAAGVFIARDRQGRQVYTNLEGTASHGKALTRLSLPPLSSIDFASTRPDELRLLDGRVTDAHNALQSGELCEGIRKSSRTPTWARLWTDHSRKLSVAAALLVFGAIAGLLGSGRRLGSVFPVAPILGCAFLCYATYRDALGTREALTAGLRACSEQLPDSDPENGGAVKSRLAKALDVQSIISQAVERQDAEIERALRER